MTQEIYELANRLKKEIDSDERIIVLNSLENQLNDSEVIMKLAYRKDIAVDKYNDMLRIYKDDSEEVINARKELATAKKELEENDLVRQYLKAYQQVRILYQNINETLFSYLNVSMCEVGK